MDAHAFDPSYAIAVDEEDFDEAKAAGMGWCPSCEAFTTGVLSSLASACICVDCGDGRVCGALHAKHAGFITVEMLS